MADEATAQPAAKRRLPVKTVGVVAALMAAEAGGLYALMSMTGPGAAHAGVELHGAPATDEEPVELPLVEDKFQNMQTGSVWVWDLQIFVKVKKKNETFVKAELERRSAEIKEGISQIVRRAQHNHLKEPDLRTLQRQFGLFLEGVLGADAEGASRIERIIIPRCKGFQAD